MRYYGYTTDFDVMKEELIQGAELTDYWNFPILEPYHGSAENTVSFRKSFEKSFSDCDHTNLNFFEDDHYFNSLWNSPFRYLEHLRKFQSVCMPDFSKSEETPLPINIWNNYRNRALAFWMQENGIDVVPTMSVMPESCWGWCWDGMPKGSTYCCCTNGMVLMRPHLRPALFHRSNLSTIFSLQFPLKICFLLSMLAVLSCKHTRF